MRVLSLCVAAVLCAGPATAQQTPIRTSLDRAAQATAQRPAGEATPSSPHTRRSPLFWTGLGVGVAGVTISTLGLTALRTEHTSTGNAPDAAYQDCVALRDSNPVYASSQCGALKGKNLGLLWGGVAVAGAGAALMIGSHRTTAELSPGRIGLFHRWAF